VWPQNVAAQSTMLALRTVRECTKMDTIRINGYATLVEACPDRQQARALQASSAFVAPASAPTLVRRGALTSTVIFCPLCSQ
jgi:hypothetical protein